MTEKLISIIRETRLDPSSFFLIAGPCAIESEGIAFEIAGHIHELCKELGIPYIFKGSYRKANRTRIDSFTGIGDEKALKILKGVGDQFNIPTTTDIHQEAEAEIAAKFADILQIPAFLCRQTDLLVAAAKTGKTVNIKKGQFLSAQSMKYAVEKVRQSGNENILLTERGTTFGYQDLIVDFRNIPAMQAFDVPVVLDCTHSLQMPNQSAGVTGGQPKMIVTIAKAGIAAGADGVFIETHPNPAKALSDGANMLPLKDLRPILETLLKIRSAINK